MDDEDKYEITLPDPDRPGQWRVMSEPLIREEALAYVQEYYGADKDGRVSLINKLPGNEIDRVEELRDESGLREAEKG